MANEPLIEETARVAAAWWGRAVCGDCRHTAGDAMINLALDRTRPPVPRDDERARFEAELAKTIAEHLHKYGSAYLDVDYGPSLMLADAFAAACRGRSAPWPVKTRMSVAPGDVTVSNGYRAPLERLMGSPVWMVSAYRPPMTKDDFDNAWTVYIGTDEHEARRLFEIVKSALPDGGVTTERQWARDKCSVLLSRDGSDATIDITSR